MNIISALFYIFAALLCISAIQTITIKNPVHAALFLILTFVSASVLFMLQGAEFLALTLILVYVGAVMVLFLFVVMMLDVKLLENMRANFLTYIPTIALVSILFLGQIFYIIYKSIFSSDKNVNNINNLSVDLGNLSNTKALGKLLFTQYLPAFEIVGCILLVAIIVAVVLTLRSRKDSKSLDVTEQVKVKPEDRLTFVSSKINK